MVLINIKSTNVTFYEAGSNTYAHCNKTALFTVMLSLCAVHVIATFATFFSKFLGIYPFEFFLVARFFVGGKFAAFSLNTQISQ